MDSIKKERPDYGQILDLFSEILVKQSESLDRTPARPTVAAVEEVFPSVLANDDRVPELA